ncbi:hypothetical protein AVP_161 [Aerococcus phage vB_AviM_AVP]|nr:hypothetical protein AVP_161 [Aerococcus phage vB_AviM_AVP]
MANLINELNNMGISLYSYSDILSQLANRKIPTDYQGSKTTLEKHNNETHLINPLEIFEDMETLENEDIDELALVDDFDLRIQDNTYNYNGNGSRDLDFKIYESYEHGAIGIIRLHMGLDIRGGYSNAFAVYGDSTDDILMQLDDIKTIATGTIELEDGNMIDFYIDGSLFNENASVYITNETVDTVADFETFELLSDDDDIINMLVSEFETEKDIVNITIN